MKLDQPRPWFAQADATRLPLADDSVDLVVGSPPYLDARTYGIAAQRKCAEWVDWMLAVTAEAVRVSRGLVVWVCAGVTRDWCYQPGPTDTRPGAASHMEEGAGDGEGRTAGPVRAAEAADWGVGVLLMTPSPGACRCGGRGGCG